VHSRLVFSSEHNESSEAIMKMAWHKVKREATLGFAKIIQIAGRFQNDFLDSPNPADLIGIFKDF
jgi:hypothetical protein